MNTQGIKKPAYFAYSFLNKLGETELDNNDESSWATVSKKGDIQILLWDFTYTLPDAVNNQAYYITDLPAVDKGKVKIALSGVAKGKYKMQIYNVGYKNNDAYTTYLSLGKPSQLSKTQVEFIKKENSGAPASSAIVTVGASGTFSRDFDIRENDVFLVELQKI